MAARRKPGNSPCAKPWEYAPQILACEKPGALGIVAELLPKRRKPDFVTTEMLLNNAYLRAIYDIDRAAGGIGTVARRARAIQDVVERLPAEIPSLPHRMSLRVHAARAMSALARSPAWIVEGCAEELRGASERNHMHVFDVARVAGELLLISLAAGQDSSACREIIVARVAEGLASPIYVKPTRSVLTDLIAMLGQLGVERARRR